MPLQSLIPDPAFLPDDVYDDSQLTSTTSLEGADTLPGTLNTPIALTENSSQVYGHGLKDWKSRYRRLANEGRTFIIGPMPVRAFLDTFCDYWPKEVSIEDMPSANDAFKDVPRVGGVESDIYNPLLEALNAQDEDGQSRCPGFVFRDTSNHPDTKGNAWVKPDIICYASDHLITVSVPNSSSRSHTDMGCAALFIEIKKSTDADPFRDPPSHVGEPLAHYTFIPPSPVPEEGELTEAEKALGQNVAYAAELCARQHRHACFSIVVCGCYARLMRWDRSGAIATRAFDLTENPEFLCEFLWRFAYMSDYERGYDLTVSRGTPTDDSIFMSAIRAHVALQQGIPEDAVTDMHLYEHYQPGAVSIVRQFNADRTERPLLVCRPVNSPLSVKGRGTRAYWAVDRETHDVVFLKDTWRHIVEGAQEEGSVLAYLNEAGVDHVPKVINHGNVPAPRKAWSRLVGPLFDLATHQSSRTHEFVNAGWAATEGIDLAIIVQHVHYRFTLSIAGYGLRHIRGAYELLTTCHHAFRAMVNASRVGIHHRDISVGNIILYREHANEDRRGYLVDWDLSWKEGNPDPHALYPCSATWQFLSINMLSDNPKPHTVRDDMESMLYVVMYSGMRWLKHTWTDQKTRRVLVDMFDQWSIWPVARPNGGTEKDQNARKRKWTRTLEFECPALNEWLTVFMDCHHRVGPSRKWLYKGWWHDPTKMDDWWGKFLQKHGDRLYIADRADRKLDHTSAQIARNNLPAVEATDTGPKGKMSVAPTPLTPSRPPTPLVSWQPVRGMADDLPDVSDPSHSGDDIPDDLPQSPPRKKFKRADRVAK